MFSRNTDEETRRAIVIKMDIREVLAHDKYLGLPTVIGRSKKKALLPIKDRIRKRIQSWTAKKLSWAGREVLVKAVAQATPTFAMSVFKFPGELCCDIQSLILRFWWGHGDEKRKIHWVAKDKLCLSKLEGGLGFRDLEAFNLALLAKQVWRLMHNPHSLVAQVLKAKYYPNCGIFNARLGSRPSYTWRSIWEARWVVEKGTRWMVGDGWSLNIWDDKWIPREDSFKVITAVKPEARLIRVGDLIDHENGEWRNEMIDHIFLPVDATVIKSIPLCNSWPSDKLRWHYENTGDFSVRSAYHLIRNSSKNANPGPSVDMTRKFWAEVWGIEVPPKVRMFAWRAACRSLPTKKAFARRIDGLDVKCKICGALEESDVHALFEYKLARQIWGGSPFAPEIWMTPFRCIWDAFELAQKHLKDRWGEFVMVAWAVWNQRNMWIFGGRNCEGNWVAARALAQMQEYKQAQTDTSSPSPKSQGTWSPPNIGIVKVNYDCAKLGECGHGRGAVGRDSEGGICFAAVAQGTGFISPEFEEAKACLFAAQQAWEYGCRSIILEGDCASLMSKLKKKYQPNSELGFIICEIFSFLSRFDLFAFSCIRRGGNRVAHTLAHLQPVDLSVRSWEENGPEEILQLVMDDVHHVLV